MFQGLNQRIAAIANTAMSAIGLGGANNNAPDKSRVPFDENGSNGLVFNNIYIPEELVAEMLCHVDHTTLLNCQLVCKRWNELLRTYVWRKKTEKVIGHGLPVNKILLPWSYYLICEKRPFERNLIKNHSGEAGLNGLNPGWKQDENHNQWITESPPIGVPPLPDDPVFEGKNVCFATSYDLSRKLQIIDLVKEGLTPYTLDVLQPPIEVSEWFSARWDCAAVYKCSVILMKDKLNNTDYKKEDLQFSYEKIIEGDEQNVWLRVSHVFKDYGVGVRKIVYFHAGQDRRYWAGHYGSKMAGACVKIKIPS